LLADIKEKILDTLKENNFNTDYTFEQIASGQMLVLDRPAASIDSRSGSGERIITNSGLIFSKTGCCLKILIT
jgi:hypothetical protein